MSRGPTTAAMERHLKPSDDRLGYAGKRNTAHLTPRQAEVLGLAANGLSDKQIATRLAISVRTVRDRFTELRRLTGTRTRAELLAYVVASGLLHLADGPGANVTDMGDGLHHPEACRSRLWCAPDLV